MLVSSATEVCRWSGVLGDSDMDSGWAVAAFDASASAVLIKAGTAKLIAPGSSAGASGGAGSAASARGRATRAGLGTADLTVGLGRWDGYRMAGQRPAREAAGAGLFGGCRTAGIDDIGHSLLLAESPSDRAAPSSPPPRAAPERDDPMIIIWLRCAGSYHRHGGAVHNVQ